MRFACLLLLAAGCGTSSPAGVGPADGGLVDGGPADHSHDPVIGAARVTVRHERLEHAGELDDTASVESFDAAGNLVARAMTDASGTATMGVTRGGSISVTHDVFRDAPYVWTFVGVEDGDDLVVAGSPFAVDDQRGSMILNLSPVASAWRYSVELPKPGRGRFWFDAPNFAIPIPVSASPTFPLYVEALAEDTTKLGFWAQEAQFRKGATLELGTSKLFGTLDVTLEHLPAEARTASASVDSWFLGNRILGQPRALASTAASPIDLGLTYPPGLDDRHTLELSLHKTAFQSDATIAMSVPIVPASAGVRLDVASHLTPWLDSFSAQNGDLTWRESGSQAYDGARFDISYFRWSDLYGFDPVVDWRVIAPRGSHPRFPHPELLASQLLVESTGYLIEDSQFDGYRDFRNNHRHVEVPEMVTTSMWRLLPYTAASSEIARLAP